MVKICEPGQIGCSECGGDAITHGSGYVTCWPWQKRLCKKCFGHGWRPVVAPPLPPNRDGVLSDVKDTVRNRFEVVILHRSEPGRGRFAVVCIDDDEVAEIPITKDQLEQDEFFAALKKLVLHLMK